MATSRPFAYNPSHTSIPGTEQLNDLAIGVDNQAYSLNLGGVQWWMGADEDLGYIICVPVPSDSQPTPISGDPASVGFYRSVDLTENSFVTLTNQTFGQNFTNGNDAKTWLNGQGYWTSFTTIHTPQVLMTLDSTTGITSNIWTDISGNGRNGTLYNDFSTKTYNSYQVLSLGGGTSYVIPISGFGTSMNPYGLTYEVWVYPTKSGNGTLISEWQGFPPTGWNDAQMALVSGNINAGVYPNTFNPSGYLSGPSFSANTWYNIVLTYDAISGDEKLYVNGNLIGTTNGTKANPPSTTLTLGRPDSANSYLGGATGYFQGYVGYWQVWDGAITSAQTLTNYVNAKYKFDNSLTLNVDATKTASYPGSGSIWYDLSGKGNNGTLTNTTYSAISGGTMVFNGTNSSVAINQPIPTGSNYSISAWVYANNVSAAHNIVSSFNSPFWVNSGTLYAGVGGNYTAVQSAGFPTNQWKFVSMTFNDTTNTMKLYVNGSLVNTNTSVTESYTAENTYIGSHFNGAPVSFWNGYIPQVYIYKSEQSATDIQNLFNNTKSTYGL